MKRKISPSFLLILLLGAILIIFRVLTPADNIVSWDVFGYYLYLPAKFIYHNLSLTDQSWLKELMEKYEPSTALYQAVQIENGNWVMKYSLGLAMIYAPFFFLAHLIASLTGYPMDGLSLPYQYTLTAGGMLFAMIGLYYFRKVLKHFFDEKVTIILLIIIFAGTNYFQLTAFDGTLISHNFLFTFYAMLLWFTIRWHQNPKKIYATLIGLLCGIMILIRPSEAVCILIPLLWNISNKKSLRDKWNLLRENASHLIIAGMMIILVFIPQIIYWKVITGKFFFYSYTNPGEGFEFLWPYTMKFLLSFRKGWLIYTPVMIFALIGFYHLYRYNRNIFYSTLIFFVISLYVISSWSCWWYASASYSSRSLVPAYTVLALPMGYFAQHVLRRRWLSIAIGLIALFLIALNLFQTWQFRTGVLSSDRMTRKYYFAIFGRTEVPENTRQLLSVERSAELNEKFSDYENYKARQLCHFDFEDGADSSAFTHSGRGAFRLDGSNPYSPGPDVPFRILTMKDHAWIRAGVWLYIPENYTEELPLLIIAFHHKGLPYKYKSFAIKPGDLKPASWHHISADYITPEVRSKKDNLKVYVWHRGQSEIWIDDLSVKVFEPADF